MPKDTPLERIGAEGVPVTYVPARNTIFLSFALGWAEVLGGRDIFIGANALDYSGYPDCRPEYIAAFERVANLGTRAGVEGDGFRIHTPLIALSKREIVLKGIELGVDFALTSTCYDPSPDGLACGRCDACLLRLKGFREAGVRGPAKIFRESVSGQQFRPAHAFSPRSRSSFPAYLWICPTPSRKSSTLCKAKVRRPAGRRFSAGSPGATCGRDGKQDRAEAVCRFCDTDFVGTDGPGGGKFATAAALAAAVAAAWPDSAEPARRFVVCTGGEPLLQMDQELVAALHAEGFEVAVETNGTQEPPPGIDWLTVSPKAGAGLAIRRGTS